jgi:rhamnosyltransferase
MKRLLIFSHYNQQGLLSTYVIFILEKFRPIFERVVFVSNSTIDQDAKKRLVPVTDKILERENSGFDFGAWKLAILEEGWDAIDSYDSLTIMNDTCFGPLYDFEIVFKEMERNGIDFWGLTNHGKLEEGLPGMKGPVPEHIQSYFASFGKTVTQSKEFRNFWLEVKIIQNIVSVIELYELNLTQLLIKAGFKYSVYVDIVNRNSSAFGLSSFYNPDSLIRLKTPFIKVKSFLLFPNPSYLIRQIENFSEYQTNLIIDHINQTYSPNISKDISNKKVIPKLCPDHNHVNKIKVAVHFHVFYTDIFEKHIESFLLPNTNFDLFITTDSNEKKELIYLILVKFGIEMKLKEIVVLENRGRDVLPWLTIASKLKNYELVGHFHTKKRFNEEEWLGESWMNELVETLVEQMDEIIELFEKEPHLGVVIPDIPYFFKKLYGVDLWHKTKTSFQDLWIKMNLKKKLDLTIIDTPIMSYGTMFWYRSLALEPLFALELSSKDFPEEPLPIDGSIAHAVESLPVYIAWNEGFDFKVVLNKNYISSGFDSNFVIKTLQSCNKIRNSFTYRIGMGILWLPKMLFSFLRKLL